MIQGGGFDQRLEKKPTMPPIQNEADNGLKNTRGTVAMARTGEPHSATAQFFVNVTDNAFLDHQAKDERGWGPWTGIYRASGGSHAGHLVTRPTGERQTGTDALKLVPLETLPYRDLHRFEVDPPWKKEVFAEPESDSS